MYHKKFKETHSQVPLYQFLILDQSLAPGSYIFTRPSSITSISPSFSLQNYLDLPVDTKRRLHVTKIIRGTCWKEIPMAWCIYGFHGAGGGGGVGNIGGTAEKMVFLSIDVLLSPDNATSAATKPAFPARVGSV